MTMDNLTVRCIDCKFYRSDAILAALGPGENARCCHDSCKKWSHVEGWTGSKCCHDMRKMEGRCGPEGKLFEKRGS